MTLPIVAGIALGVASSAHCAAMCGPLVLAFGPARPASSRLLRLRHALLYHAGRTAMYVALALPAGLGGEIAVLAGFGRILAIAAGVILLLSAAGSLPVPGLFARISGPIYRWARPRPTAGPVAAGALNGLLPCGLVYAALAAAAATGGIADAAALMLGFGLGTAPVLVAMAASAGWITPALRLRLRPLVPLVLAVAAATLIVRGLMPAHRHDQPVPAAQIHHGPHE
jgi:sulfite exporter TauE/SafE